MRVGSVEVLSDRTSTVVLRHSGRAFPGVLVQGDNLYDLCARADRACREVGRGSQAMARWMNCATCSGPIPPTTRWRSASTTCNSPSMRPHSPEPTSHTS